MAITERMLNKGNVQPRVDHPLEPIVGARKKQITHLDSKLRGLRVLFESGEIEERAYKNEKMPLVTQRHGLSAEQSHDRIQLRRHKRSKEARKSPFKKT